MRGHDAWITKGSFSPDGEWVVTASFDGTARLWDARTGSQLFVLEGHGNVVQSARFSPGGERVVTAGYDRSARIWDSSTGRQLALLKGHGGSHGVTTMSDALFSPDGERVVTTANDGTARLWDCASGQEIVALRPAGGNQAAFSRLGTLLVTHAGKAATVWDLRWGVVLRGAALVEQVLKEKLAGAYDFTRDDEDETGLAGIEGTTQLL